MFGLGYQELLIIFAIVLILFGGKKIPEVARGLGRGIREFKHARDDISNSMNDPTDAPGSLTATATEDDDATKPSSPA